MPEPHVIAPSGEIDIIAARTLSYELNAIVGDLTRQPIVDLSEITFIDSAGLGAIIHAQLVLERQQRELLVVAPRGGVAATLLEKTGMRGHMPVHLSREAALQAVG
jgi:anti-anti-sigma factor